MLPFVIFAWGTAYKLSLYKPDKGGAPAKVCTRASDAAKSGVSQAIDGHKVLGNGISPSQPVTSFLVIHEPAQIALFEAFQAVLWLQAGPTIAARPPPLGFHFS